MALSWNRSNDRRFGPFTFSVSDDCKPWAIVLRSRSEEQPCHLRISLGRYTVLVGLPNIIKPVETRINYKKRGSGSLAEEDAYYVEVDPCEYGFSLYDELLSVYFGRTGGPTMDSSVQQSWHYLLPWTQLRLVRYNLYDRDGRLVYQDSGYPSEEQYAAKAAAVKNVSRSVFEIEDFDGEKITATTVAEEREWRAGTGWFKWLSWFKRPLIVRRLAIDFSAEVGPDKGSWKGGVMGTSVVMNEHDTPEMAFKRWCSETHNSRYKSYNVKFNGAK